MGPAFLPVKDRARKIGPIACQAIQDGNGHLMERRGVRGAAAVASGFFQMEYGAECDVPHASVPIGFG